VLGCAEKRWACLAITSRCLPLVVLCGANLCSSVVGDGGVGKTALIHRFLSDDAGYFDFDDQDPFHDIEGYECATYLVVINHSTVISRS
jgi:hypothetical protein